MTAQETPSAAASEAPVAPENKGKSRSREVKEAYARKKAPGRPKGSRITPKEWKRFVTLVRRGTQILQAGASLGWAKSTTERVWYNGLGYGTEYGMGQPVKELLTEERLRGRGSKNRAEVEAKVRQFAENFAAVHADNDKGIADAVARLLGETDPKKVQEIKDRVQNATSVVKKAREDAVRSRRQELQLVEITRLNVTVLASAAGTWSESVGELTTFVNRELHRMLRATPPEISMKDALTIINRIQSTSRGIVEMVRNVVGAQRDLILTKDPTLELPEEMDPAASMDTTAAVERLERVGHMWERARANGWSLVEGGVDGKPIITTIGEEPELGRSAFQTVPQGFGEGGALPADADVEGLYSDDQLPETK